MAGVARQDSHVTTAFPFRNTGDTSAPAGASCAAIRATCSGVVSVLQTAEPMPAPPQAGSAASSSSAPRRTREPRDAPSARRTATSLPRSSAPEQKGGEVALASIRTRATTAISLIDKTYGRPDLGGGADGDAVRYGLDLESGGGTDQHAGKRGGRARPTRRARCGHVRGRRDGTPRSWAESAALPENVESRRRRQRRTERRVRGLCHAMALSPNVADSELASEGAALLRRVGSHSFIRV